ncbi:alpha/beta fold hydrolase [Arthrobacter sp.]|uniref:alpha/beta fold hydrolase n=1 Tax=Arthrobacter sp. TaxID=1667 RepID=UPI003A9460D7
MAGPDVFFIPGTLMPPSCFDGVAVPTGASGATVDWMAEVRPCGMDAVVRHVLGRAAERGPAVLVGHSTGGAIAALAALRRPDLVAGLVLINSGPNMVGHGAVAGMLERLTGPTDDAMWEEFARANVPGGSPGDWIDAMVDYGRRIGGAQAAAILADQAAIDLLDTPPRTGLPVEVLHGALDAKRTIGDAKAWAHVFPDAHLEVLADCGHTPPLERPQAVASALGRLARRIRTARA